MCFWWLVPCRDCGEGVGLGHMEKRQAERNVAGVGGGEGGFGGSFQGVGVRQASGLR